MPQENNMAEVIRLLHTVIGKVDGLATGLKKVESDVQVVKTDIGRLESKTDRLDSKTDRLESKTDRLETKTDRLDGKFDVLSGQFQDVARVVIEDTQRITGLENRVDNLERKAN